MNNSFNDSQNVDIDARRWKLLEFSLLFLLQRTLLLLLPQKTVFQFIETRTRNFLTTQHIACLLLEKAHLKLLSKTLLLYIFFLETIQLTIIRYQKLRLNQTFTIVLCHKVAHLPLNPLFSFLVEQKIARVERMVFLSLKKERRPPPFKPLKRIPCLLPKSFQIKHKSNFFYWIFKRFNIFSNVEPLADKDVSIHIFYNEIDLYWIATT